MIYLTNKEQPVNDEQTTSELVEQFNKGQNHALRIIADLLGTSMPTHQNVASKIEALQKRADNATRIARTRGDEIKALQARVDALENGLRDIAGQRRIAEIVEHHGYEKLDECDFEGAYDILITIARAALETRKETP
jgi:polyhydroxyalkanoate synthesis regulator phasin